MVEVIPPGWRIVVYVSEDAPPHAAAMGRLMMRGAGVQAKKMVFHPVIFAAATAEEAHADAAKWLVGELKKAREAEEKAAIAEAAALAKARDNPDKPKKAKKAKAGAKGDVIENIAAALDEVEAVAQAAEPEPEDDDGEVI